MKTVEVETPIWYDIEPDGKMCKCEYCKRQGLTDEFVFIDRRNDMHPILVHKKCLHETWLERTKKGEGVKHRTVAKIWHSRNWPPKLKSVKKPGKIDYRIPKEMKAKKKKK